MDKGEIILSCGHQSEVNNGFGYDLALGDYDKEGNPAILYGSYCEKCKEDMESYILKTREEQDIWMSRREDMETIKKLMAKHNIAVVTEYSYYSEDELACEPIIWTTDDLEEVEIDPEVWRSVNGGRALKDTSIEYGWDIMRAVDLQQEQQERI